jgi:hypothetical protein
MEPRFSTVRADLVRGLRMEAEALRANGRETDGKALEAEAAHVEEAAAGASHR